MNNQELDIVKIWIKELNSIQTLNSIFQYLPQFLFQAYLISFRKYKCVLTGVAAGLAGFSFLWYIFIYFYYVIKRYNEQDILNDSDVTNLSTRIIDNLSTSPLDTCRNISPGNSLTHSSISGKLKNFEKPLYKTDDKNFVSKKQATKTIEKEHIFSFNKRKPIYKQEEFDLYDVANQSTEFFELNESSAFSPMKAKQCDSSVAFEKGESSNNSIDNNRGTQLKRKGICSSQEMLHLVDIMNDNIPPEQIDVLAKNLAELSGGEEEGANLIFPKLVDQKTLENIDAAIYENQIIFQERIRKNQLTIQNLKLQDEILSNGIIDIKLDNNNDYLCDVNRLNRLKHWRNYLRDLDTNLHDNSTVLNSSYYMVTTTSGNSYADLYITEPDNDLLKYDSIPSSLTDKEMKKTVRWCDKIIVDDDLYDMSGGSASGSGASVSLGDGSRSEQMYFDKNILVETINKINTDSPLKVTVHQSGDDDDK